MLCRYCRLTENLVITVPASRMRPINSLRPMLSKSITITSSEHSLIFSQGTLKENVSLNTGFRVHLKTGVFLFSIRFSPNCNHTFTYGSETLRFCQGYNQLAQTNNIYTIKRYKNKFYIALNVNIQILGRSTLTF